jgi:hypothetical protein
MENKLNSKKEFIIPIKREINTSKNKDNKNEVLNIEMNINLKDPEEFNKNILQLRELIKNSKIK